MMWPKWLKKTFLRTRQSPINVIIVGIDTPSYQLAQKLLETQKVTIIAFIDDEPWTNRTELLGATVRYPSDMAALIIRHEVKLIIDFEGVEMVPDSIYEELSELKCQQVLLKSKQSNEQWIDLIEKALAT
jgi:FlaA1/EpsC-like NDP-sugar epimerase